VTTFLVAGFLLLHGLLHLAVWLPKPEPAPGRPAPFEPDHSAVLTQERVPQRTIHHLAILLASTAAVLYGVVGLAVAVGTSWAVPLAVLAGTVGIAIKLLFFHPWLSVGIAIDLLVLSSALVEWPFALV
jgi:hypothetical protein